MKKTIRRILLICGCLFTVVCLAAQTPDARTMARDAMNSGIAAFKSGNAQLAVDSFTRALELDPNLTDAELYRGAVYASLITVQNSEMSRKAVESFERVLQKQPNNEEATSRLATLYLGSGDASRARSLFMQLTKSSPQNVTAFYSLGVVDWTIAYNKADPLPETQRIAVINEGLQSLDTALALDPRHADAMTYRNLLLRQKAEITTDATERARLLSESDAWFNRALEARAQTPTNTVAPVSGVGAAPPPPPPPPPLPPPPPPPPPPSALRVGGQVAQANLVRQVPPVYPQAARDARLQGTVLLQTTIDRVGRVVDISVISGHPLLNDAAVQAVQQWTYQPVLLNGQPVDVVTTVTVNFVLR